MRHRSLPRRPIVLTAALFGVVAIALGGCASDSDYSGNATTTTKRAQASTTTPSTISTVPATTAPSDIVGTALNGHMFNSLAGLAIQAGLVAALRGGPFTVFAPTDDAFAKLPLPVLHAVEDNKAMLASVLQHHVVKGAISPGDLLPGQLTTLAGDQLTVTRVGERTYVDGNLVGANIKATNGEVYVMGDVLVPALGDIVAVAQALPGFSTLTGLVAKAGLTVALQAAGPFTVFAPTDDAFASLPQATLDAVLADPKLLASLLDSHVVAGKLDADQLADGQLRTISGVNLTVSHQNETTLIDGHPIVVQNVQATNGVIHVVGAVLVPAS